MERNPLEILKHYLCKIQKKQNHEWLESKCVFKEGKEVYSIRFLQFVDQDILFQILPNEDQIVEVQKKGLLDFFFNPESLTLQVQGIIVECRENYVCILIPESFEIENEIHYSFKWNSEENLWIPNRNGSM